MMNETIKPVRSQMTSRILLSATHIMSVAMGLVAAIPVLLFGLTANSRHRQWPHHYLGAAVICDRLAGGQFGSFPDAPFNRSDP